jgi:hypothetical protein
MTVSGVAASMRGPGISPALMALRMTTSSRGLAAAALLMLVKPLSLPNTPSALA